jgi:hypothetical protein
MKYTVIFMLALGFASCKKSSFLSKTSSAIAGSHTWHGRMWGSIPQWNNTAGYYVGHDYDSNITRTLSITEINESTVSMLGDTLKCISTSDGKVVYRLGDLKSPIYTQLTYYIAGDSLHYEDRYAMGHAATEERNIFLTTAP